MKIYVIKIAVRGVSPMVWRRLRIAADTSLAALHFIFQIVQGWDDDYLHQFHIYGKDYGISYDGGIGFPDNPFMVRRLNRPFLRSQTIDRSVSYSQRAGSAERLRVKMPTLLSF
jgi:hypothetical protein